VSLVSLLGLLSTGPGTAIYHLLVIPSLGMMVIIALIEWQRTHNPDYRRILWAFAGLLALRIPALFGELLGPTIMSPLAAGMEAASLALLGWAFLPSVLSPRVRTPYLLCSLGVTLFLVAVFLPSWHRALVQMPDLEYAAFWQQSFWHAVSALLALIPIVVLLLHRQREEYWMQALGLAILFLGFATLCAGSLFLAAGWPGEVGHTVIGVGRFINLLGYPFFAIVVYHTAMQDMRTYRQELQAMSEEALRQAQELFFLVEASRTTGESLDLDTILNRVVESTCMALDADCAAIFLIDSDQPDTATLAAHYTPLQRADGPVAQPSFSLSKQPALDYALQRRKQLSLNAETDNPRLYALYELLGSQESGPAIIQPLLRQRRVLGALVVGNDHSRRPFGPNQCRLCQSIAVQIAAAVENARLYRDLQAQASQLAELLQLQEDEVRQRTAILESMAEGVIVGDGKGQVVIVNAAAERILGVPRQRIQGRLLKRLAGHMALDPGVDWHLIAQSDAPLQTVFELENKAVHINAAPVLTLAGDRLGVVAILRDITRETEAERTKREFVAAISHELRTPLTAIQGYAEVLSGGMAGKVSEAQSYFFKIIRDNVFRMTSLTENLIAISELEKEGVRLEYGETDLHLIAGEALRSFRGEIEDRQLEVSLDLDNELHQIEADPARVRQILDNLVSNAVKFTFPGGQVTIGAKLLREGGQEPAYCTLWVADAGIGIAPEEQAHVWERFYRPSNPLAAEASGLGVGLSIVKSLVEAHGGRIWLESVPGEGSTFTVVLPIKRARQLGD